VNIEPAHWSICHLNCKIITHHSGQFANGTAIQQHFTGGNLSIELKNINTPQGAICQLNCNILIHHCGIFANSTAK
jgi:hypothetical protein